MGEHSVFFRILTRVTRILNQWLVKKGTFDHWGWLQEDLVYVCMQYTLQWQWLDTCWNIHCNTVWISDLVRVTICCKNTAPWVSVLCLWYSDMHDADSALLLPGARLRPAPAPLSIYTPAAAAPQQLSKTMRPIIIKVSTHTSLIFGFPCFCMQFIVCRKRYRLMFI